MGSSDHLNTLGQIILADVGYLNYEPSIAPYILKSIAVSQCIVNQKDSHIAIVTRCRRVEIQRSNNHTTFVVETFSMNPFIDILSLVYQIDFPALEILYKYLVSPTCAALFSVLLLQG